MATPSERRSAILKAAARLFEHYGHGKTTIADVAREAQVGVGTVYLEFESKEAIVSELSLSTHVGVLEAMRAASTRGADHAERLTAVFVVRTECFLQLGAKGQHACELLHCKTEGVQSAHQRFRDQERALIVQLLQEGQQAGVFARSELSATAALIQRAFASLSPPWIFSTNDADAIHTARSMIALLLSGLIERGSSPSRSITPTGRGKRSASLSPSPKRAR